MELGQESPVEADVTIAIEVNRVNSLVQQN